MNEVSLTGLRKHFGSLEVIHGVDLKIEEGGFCVLVDQFFRVPSKRTTGLP